MTLQQFIDKYDYAGSIVLLEGKRDVATDDKEKLERLGEILASNTKHILFRSGNANGADFYFSKGVSRVDAKRLQVVVPYTGHMKKQNTAYDTVSLDNINLAEEPEIVYHSKKNKKTETLIDKYVAGDRNRFAIKAAYIIRDTVKVIGSSEIPPATFAIFYDDLKNPGTGGTGHTMNICEHNDVKYMTQEVWFDWLENKQ
jgi:hypothetical protein